MKTYQASATEQGSHWIIRVPEINTVIEATSEIDIVASTRQHISDVLQVPGEDVGVDLGRLTYQPQH